MLAEDKRALAYHEAGHAVAAYYLQPENRVLKATIIRSGDALGVVQQRSARSVTRGTPPDRDRHHGVAGRARGGQVPRHADDRAVERPRDREPAAEDYVGSLGMGPTQLVVPMAPGSPPIGPVLVAADELLDQLYVETERLLREKEPARARPGQGAHRARTS